MIFTVLEIGLVAGGSWIPQIGISGPSLFNIGIVAYINSNRDKSTATAIPSMVPLREGTGTDNRALAHAVVHGRNRGDISN